MRSIITSRVAHHGTHRSGCRKSVPTGVATGERLRMTMIAIPKPAIASRVSRRLPIILSILHLRSELVLRHQLTGRTTVQIHRSSPHQALASLGNVLPYSKLNVELFELIFACISKVATQVYELPDVLGMSVVQLIGTVAKYCLEAVVPTLCPRSVEQGPHLVLNGLVVTIKEHIQQRGTPLGEPSGLHRIIQKRFSQLSSS